MWHPLIIASEHAPHTCPVYIYNNITNTHLYISTCKYMTSTDRCIWTHPFCACKFRRTNDGGTGCIYIVVWHSLAGLVYVIYLNTYVSDVCKERVEMQWSVDFIYLHIQIYKLVYVICICIYTVISICTYTGHVQGVFSGWVMSGFHVFASLDTWISVCYIYIYMYILDTCKEHV